METGIHLFGEQLVLTAAGYTPISSLWTQFVSGDAMPRLASWDIAENQFKWAELLRIERSYHMGEVIQLMTDVFEVVGTPEHQLWFHNPLEPCSASGAMGELCGLAGQAMGIYPLSFGHCTGYVVGESCWYRHYAEDFLFALSTSDGLVFTRTRSKEAGVWSGCLTVQNSR